ncbi:DUF6186 family protein [Nocardia carnea]|uniref:DUF6186 family protein n=1 Tax=Nocardia carnea TaxID=37328 RepID=UPI0024545302|nr:DUF6186 family protein [Nocardia carnea]
MAGRTLILLGFATLAAAGVAAQLFARHHPGHLMTFDRTLRVLQRSRLVRVLLLCAWAWLGWHFLAR